MDLVNATPVPARLGRRTGSRAGDAGVLTAKATYSWADGAPKLDTQAPYPIFLGDVETELGLLPNDRVDVLGDDLEIIVLGAAYSNDEAPTAERRVSLAVGESRWELVVTGDRRWIDDAASLPEPFKRMPLTWTRAFGGSCTVEVDREAYLDVVHPMNALGRGADFTANVEVLAKELAAPAGYPRWARDLRLPNVEDPASAVRARGDDPLPMCWATIPLGLGMHMLRAIGRVQERPPRHDAETTMRELWQRGHPALVLPALPEGTICLEGLAPGAPVEFDIPRLDVLLDVETRDAPVLARPRLLVLLPEERRFYVVHRASFALDAGPPPGARLLVRERGRSAR